MFAPDGSTYMLPLLSPRSSWLDGRLDHMEGDCKHVNSNLSKLADYMELGPGNPVLKSTVALLDRIETRDNDLSHQLEESLEDSLTFSVGESCWANFSEDGEWYKAVIDEIDVNQGIYFVTYEEYGNSEALFLEYLKKTGAEDDPSELVDLDEATQIVENAQQL